MATVDMFKFAKNGEQFPAGTVIFEEGESGDLMYVVQAGALDVFKDDTLIETVAAGGIVGEMALVDASPRSATVRARTDCTLVPLNEEEFLNHVHTTPFFSLQVMRVVVMRLRRLLGADEG